MEQVRFNTISEFHRFRQLPPPEHPLLSVFSVESVGPALGEEPLAWSYGFYCIAIKRMVGAENIKLKYGQQPYDFEAGVMSFVAPNQVLRVAAAGAEPVVQSGWLLLIHPDFLWNTPLASTIKQYAFWSYSVAEALFLSEKEEAVLLAIVRQIQREYQATLDTFSKRIVVAHVEALLHYADRFYHRQFLTREKANHELLGRLDELLNTYFDNKDLASAGLPSVQYISAKLNLSPTYLRSLLKVLTGQNTQQHIHEKLIAKAKEKLSTTTLSISEVAYELGFEHVQSFSKLFKAKTALSPLDFRQTYN